MNNKQTFAQEMLAIQAIAKKSKVLAKAQFDPKLKERYDKAIADSKPIIDKIKGLAEKAAANDEDGCAVMDLKSGEDKFFSDYTYSDTNGLKPNEDLPAKCLGVTAKAVYDYCRETLKIETCVRQGITSWDERGMTYFKIWIIWKSTPVTSY